MQLFGGYTELFRGYVRLCWYWKSDVHHCKCGWFRMYRALLRIYRVHLRIFGGYPTLCCYWKSHVYLGRCRWIRPRRFEQSWESNCTARLPCENPPKVRKGGFGCIGLFCGYTEFICGLVYSKFTSEFTVHHICRNNLWQLLPVSRYRADFSAFLPRVGSTLHRF